ncbi:MAG: C40 family peptidase [Oscillospiraceae bacterium]|nr:C40 family peptidase [Oscillospiraceae bacterium]
MAKTAAGLLAHCKAQLGQLYWYGTFGQAPTLNLLNQKRAQYPERITAARYDYAKKHHVGLPNTRVFDCAGLIKSYWMMDSPTAKPKYIAAYDKSANGLKACCALKGPISKLPEQPGLLVFMDGHVGIYIGGGKVVEARGFDYGVVETNLKARPWLEWGALSWLENEPKTEKEETCKCDCCKK